MRGWPLNCDGEDVSPPLQWSDPPQGAQSLALIMDDPGAPVGTWDHWLLFNLPADLRNLPEQAGPPLKRWPLRWLRRLPSTKAIF